MKRGRNIVIALVLVVFATYAVKSWPGRALHLPPVNATHAGIVIYSNLNAKRTDSKPGKRALLEFQTTDGVAIQELVTALQEGRVCSDHKCGPLGTIELGYASGDLSMDFLPGHADGFYEVRLQGDIYRIPRAAFTKGLVACGVPYGVIPLHGQ